MANLTKSGRCRDCLTASREFLASCLGSSVHEVSPRCFLVGRWDSESSQYVSSDGRKYSGMGFGYRYSVGRTLSALAEIVATYTSLKSAVRSFCPDRLCPVCEENSFRAYLATPEGQERARGDDSIMAEELDRRDSEQARERYAAQCQAREELYAAECQAREERIRPFREAWEAEVGTYRELHSQAARRAAGRGYDAEAVAANARIETARRRLSAEEWRLDHREALY